MLSEFSAPPTVTCFLCKAWISVKNGDKTRFLHHISSDHEVHFDLELIFVLSTMAAGEREAIVNNNPETEVAKEKGLEKDEETGDIDTTQVQVRPKRLRVEIEKVHLEDLPQEPQSSSRSKLVKCSKCNKWMKRAHLRSHIAANHKKGRKSRKKIEEKDQAKGARRDLVELVDVMTKDLASLVECLFCEERMRPAEQRAHMRKVHKTDVDPKTLKQEVVSLENRKDLKIPPRQPKPEPTLPSLKEKCEICQKKVEAAKMKHHHTRLHPGLSLPSETRLSINI